MARDVPSSFSLRELLREIADDLGLPLENLRKVPAQALPDGLNNPPDRILSELNEYGKLVQLSFISRPAQNGKMGNLIASGAMPLLMIPEEGGQLILLTEHRGKWLKGKVFTDLDTWQQTWTEDELESEMKQYSSRWQALSILYLPSSFSTDNTDEYEKYEGHPTPVQRFFRIIRLERRDITLVLVYALASGLLSLTLPLGVQSIVGMVAGGLLLEPVIIMIAFVVFGVLFSGILQIFQLRVVESIQQRVFARTAFEFARHLPKIRIESLRNAYAPELMNRFFDITTIQKGLSKMLTDVTSSTLNLLFGLLLLTLYHPLFIGFGVLLVTIMVLLFRFTAPRGLKTSLLESKHKYKVVHWLEEAARTLASFKLAGFTSLVMDRMDEHLTQYLRKRQAHFRILVFQFAGVVGFKVLVAGGVLILGALLVISREMTLGQYVAAEIVIITIMSSVEKIIMNLETAYDLVTAAEKVGTVTDLPGDPERQRFLPRRQNSGISLCLEAVSYPDSDKVEKRLDDINLEIKAGERIGLVGTAGSGKSTLLQIMAGLLYNYTGSILVDDVPLRELNSSSYRDQVGQCLSLNQLFEGSIAENIGMGKPGMSLEQIQHSIEIAGLQRFIQRQPEGYLTSLQPGGSDLPASITRQLLIARALAEDPRLFLVEEGFLPTELSSDNSFLQYLLDRTKPFTAVVITAHPEYLQKCDRILALKDGHIYWSGSYEGLLAHPDYTDLVPQNMPNN